MRRGRERDGRTAVQIWGRGKGGGGGGGGGGGWRGRERGETGETLGQLAQRDVEIQGRGEP
jgi:hypothetical protein